MSTLHQQPRATARGGRALRAAVLALTTAGLTAGIAAPATAATPVAAVAEVSSSAAAATPTFANLQVIALGGGQYRIVVDGVLAMSRYDAQGYLNNLGSRGGMQYRVMGFDGLSGSEERGTTYYSGPSMPGTHAGGWLYAGTEGIHFHRDFQVSGSVLNEDRGWIDYDDEIWVRVRFVDGDGGIREVPTNIIHGYY